jgi:hypothetical protein
VKTYSCGLRTIRPGMLIPGSIFAALSEDGRHFAMGSDRSCRPVLLRGFVLKVPAHSAIGSA